jgi:hypothetical protein
MHAGTMGVMMLPTHFLNNVNLCKPFPVDKVDWKRLGTDKVTAAPGVNLPTKTDINPL